MASFKRIGNFNLGKTAKGFQRLKLELPVKLGNMAVNHFKEGFKTGGGQTDASKSGWKSRQRGAPRDAGRAILVDTGALRRDIKRRSVSWPRTVIGAGYSTRTRKYASRHNRGLSGMPKREFIGVSSELRQKAKKKINTEVKRVFA